MYTVQTLLTSAQYYLPFAVCKLLKQGVTSIIGPMSSTAVKASHPMCLGFAMPMITPSATDPMLNNRDAYRYLLRIMPPDSMQSRALVDFIKYFRWDTVAILTDSTDYGRWCLGLQRIVNNNIIPCDRGKLPLKNAEVRLTWPRSHCRNFKMLIDLFWCILLYVRPHQEIIQRTLRPIYLSTAIRTCTACELTFNTFAITLTTIVTLPISPGINGLVEFQTKAAENKWRVMSVQQFEATANASDVNAREQLKQIKGTGTVHDT